MGRRPPTDRRRAVWCVAAGVGGLAAIAFAYWFTYEPAPGIRVTWESSVTDDQRASLEARYQLSNRRAPHPDDPRSLAYDLLDTRRSNIEALVTDPAVVDLNDIDDEHFRVRLGTAYGDEWMWVAHRTPGLRRAGVRWTLIAALTAMAVFGVAALVRRPVPATG
jgi:hypothetical protein